MAERIADAIDGDERLLVEAGTGTGKTLAYLVPALLSGRKVVVSTGTKTLQDQIATVDLPRLRAMFDRAGLLPRAARVGGDEGARQLRLPAAPGRARPAAIAGRASRSWTGCSRSRRRRRPAIAPTWPTSPTTRRCGATSRRRPRRASARAAPTSRRCFVTAMRRRAAAAPLIIVNHHLFFADLALRARWPEAQVLPPYEVVIFDEAHQIEDVATEFFGVHASTQRLFALARDLGRETGVDAPAGAGGRRAAQGRHRRAGGRAARPGCPRRAPGLEEARIAFPADLDRRPRARPLPRARRARSSRSPTGWTPTATRWPPSRRPAELAGLARRAAALRADLAAAGRPAAAANTCAGWPPRPATSACTPRPSTSARCWGARSTPAPGRSCSPPRR